MDIKLITAVISTEYRRFFGEPVFFMVSFLRPYLWTLLLSEGIRHSFSNSRDITFIGIISYCIIFTGITSSFSLCWERHYGFLKLWFVSGVNNINYIVGKLIFSCTLSMMVIVSSVPLCLILDIKFSWLTLFMAIPDILLSIMLVSSIGLLVASMITRLDLFGIVINFILFPMLFTSGAVYDVPDNMYVSFVSLVNPFRWSIEPLKCIMDGYCIEGSFLFVLRAIIVVAILVSLYVATRMLSRDY